MQERIFIASASENLEVAYAVQENLSRVFETQVWTQGAFSPSQYPLEALTECLSMANFGIFVLEPVDSVVSRGEIADAPRDNIVFELGLFVGALGKSNCFLIAPQSGANLKWPSDLSGILPEYYDDRRSDGNLVAALGPVTSRIRRAIDVRSEIARSARKKAVDSALFRDLIEDFSQRIKTSKQVDLLFIHSRRWRENNHDFLEDFLVSGGELRVFLPDIRKRSLDEYFRARFQDGRHIEAFVREAYSYFGYLGGSYESQIKVYLFPHSPSYSIYGFDREYLIALYPNSVMKRSVPTFALPKGSSLAQYVSQDLERLENESSLATSDILRELSGEQDQNFGAEDTNNDLSQIRWMLSLTPMERLQVLQDFVDSVELLKRGRRT